MLARFNPAPGRVPVSKELSEFVHMIFILDEYVKR